MDESIGSHHALQVALCTLKERCQQLQERLTQLEDENVTLRMKINTSEEDNEGSVSELCKLRQKVAELTEQKEQLKNNKAMVILENKHLWNRLSKLMCLKQSLDTKLNTISSSFLKDLSSSNGKTDKDDILDVNGRISLDLEDISLKLISNIAKEKSELELQCSEMMELQNTKLLNSSHGYCFSYSIENIDDSTRSFDDHVDELKGIKRELLRHKEMLQKNLKNLENTLKRKKSQESNQNKDKSTFTSFPNKADIDLEEEMQLESLVRWATPNNSGTFDIDNKIISQINGNKHSSNTPIVVENTERICPMCTKIFTTVVNFDDFQNHVESHFIIESDVN